MPLVGVENLAQYAVQRAIDERDNLVKHHVDSDYVYPYTIGDVSAAEALKGETVTNKGYGSGWEHYKSVEKADSDIMQLHAPIIAGCESLFAQQLAGIVAEEGYSTVVLMDAIERRPAELAETSTETPFVHLIRSLMPEGVVVEHVVEDTTVMEARNSIIDV